jgi:hypothetical protein
VAGVKIADAITGEYDVIASFEASDFTVMLHHCRDDPEGRRRGHRARTRSRSVKRPGQATGWRRLHRIQLELSRLACCLRMLPLDVVDPHNRNVGFSISPRVPTWERRRKMDTAKGSLDVWLPAETAHQKWLEWAGGTAGTGRTPNLTQVTEYLPPQKLPASLSRVDSGTCYFQGNNGATRVTIELRQSPTALRRAARTDWTFQRIVAYLRRFKNFAEGRQPRKHKQQISRPTRARSALRPQPHRRHVIAG